MATTAKDCSVSNDIKCSTPYKIGRTENICEASEGVNNISVHEYSLKSTSWVELLEQKDESDQEETREEGEITSSEMSYLGNVKNTSEDSNTSQPREFAIEILDASNEAKFDRLLKEEKIKSPFRRHSSNEGFDESRKIELEQLKNHDPSILDFKIAAGFNIPNHVAESVLVEFEEARDGFEMPNPSASVTKSPMKRKHIEKTLESGEADQKKPRFYKDRSESTSSSENGGYRPYEIETDPGILERRQKNIDYGKNTIGYDNYIEAVPKHKRTKDHPRTPQKHLKYSRRAWDGLVKQWRKQLHAWDTENQDGNDNEEDDDENLIY